MDIKMIPLSRLEADPKGTLDECIETGQTLVIELPDHRLVSIQPLEPASDDSLVDELLASNPAFQAAVERSRRSPRTPFPVE